MTSLELAFSADPKLPCPVADLCGGCPLMTFAHEEQLSIKLASLGAALAQTGLSLPQPSWLPSARVLGYRNRIRLRFDAHGGLGFFNPAKEQGCAILEPKLERLVRRAREFSRAQAAHLQRFAHVELRSADDDGLSGACFYAHSPESVTASDLDALQTLGSEVLVGAHGVHSASSMPRQRKALADDVYAFFPLDAFIQVHSEANRTLVARLRNLAVLHGVRSFVDFFAGCGNLSLPLLREGICGACVEVSPSASYALQLASERQGLAHVEALTSDAATAARALLEAGRNWDLMILDAPRAGVRDGLDAMAQLARRYIALVSCNPQSLARDLRELSRLGFTTRQLFLLDMFAQTKHVEVLAWLARD